MKYIIKHNMPVKYMEEYVEYPTHRAARMAFLATAIVMADKYYIKVTYREKPLRGTIQVQIDGFYYYVELYKE